MGTFFSSHVACEPVKLVEIKQEFESSGPQVTYPNCGQLTSSELLELASRYSIKRIAFNTSRLITKYITVLLYVLRFNGAVPEWKRCYFYDVSSDIHGFFRILLRCLRTFTPTLDARHLNVNTFSRNCYLRVSSTG